jgi:pimeloyl-ACP methyl ester carboxylesterase
VPTLQIWGTADKYLSLSSAKGGAKYNDDFEEVYLDGVSHFVQSERPELVNAAMEKYLDARKQRET